MLKLIIVRYQQWIRVKRGCDLCLRGKGAETPPFRFAARLAFIVATSFEEEKVLKLSRFNFVSVKRMFVATSFEEEKVLKRISKKIVVKFKNVATSFEEEKVLKQ